MNRRSSDQCCHWCRDIAAELATLAVEGRAPVETTTDSWGLAAAGLAVLAWSMFSRDPAEVGDYVRTPIPHAVVEEADGTTHSLLELAQEQARLLIFLSPGCAPCHEVAQRIPVWSPQIWPVAVHAVIMRESADEFSSLAPVHLFTDEDDSAPRELGIQFTPAVVLLGSDGLLAGGPVSGAPAIEELVTELLAE